MIGRVKLRLKFIVVSLCLCLINGFAVSEEILDSSIYSPFSGELKPLISKHQIEQKIQNLANTLESDYAGKDIVFVAVMKGSVCFVSDLMMNLNHRCHLEIIRASSYGLKGAQRGELTVLGLGSLSLQDKHVIIVDDICDSGQTMIKLKNHLAELNPASIKTLVLLTKNVEKLAGHSKVDYSLFDIEDHFVVGYGLDYKEYFRNLPGIYLFESRQQ